LLSKHSLLHAIDFISAPHTMKMGRVACWIGIKFFLLQRVVTVSASMLMERLPRACAALVDNLGQSWSWNAGDLKIIPHQNRYGRIIEGPHYIFRVHRKDEPAMTPMT
jgi:hypothetical protein